MDQSLAEFCKHLPKVELHAHLNGSLTYQTIQELYKIAGVSSGVDTESLNQWKRITSNIEGYSLQECFQLFGVVHALTSSPAALSKATQDVIQDFANDGTTYLELRSTPREVPGNMTKAEYIETIAEAILDSSCSEILVKLIVSVDRRQGWQAAEENVNLALRAKLKFPDILVGIDLSGDPNCGDIKDFLPVLLKARNLGLKVAVHCGEIPNEDEIMEILHFKPDRLGHATCVHPESGGSEVLWNALLESKIPVEICLTSNVRCTTIHKYEDHHVKHIIASKHPMTLATDDKGVFNTTLSQEWKIAAEYFHLSKDDLISLSLASIEYGFCSEQEKLKLREKVMKWKINH